MEREFDVIVVGGGVLGTFHAYHALLAGKSVAILEKNNSPQGASVRNFGQVVPSGMNSRWQNYGRESLRIYKSIQEQVDITVRQNGSVYLASDEEEITLLEELHDISRSNSYNSHLLTASECVKKYPGLRRSYVRAGLYFPEEVTIEPRSMIHRLHSYLSAEKGLKLFYRTQARYCDAQMGNVKIFSSSGEVFTALKVFICNGSDFNTLYPNLFANSDLEVAKIQMMQTAPQPPGYQLPGSILTGWSIRRYESFCECPSHTAIKAREAPDRPEKKWGVHILFKQAVDGSVILGDSHEYANAGEMDTLGFDIHEEINNFLIEEAKKIIDLPLYDIRHKWFGIYSQCKKSDIFQLTIDDHIHVVTGIGGKGMTGSPGFARYNIEQHLK